MQIRFIRDIFSILLVLITVIGNIVIALKRKKDIEKYNLFRFKYIFIIAGINGILFLIYTLFIRKNIDSTIFVLIIFSITITIYINGKK